MFLIVMGRRLVAGYAGIDFDDFDIALARYNTMAAWIRLSTAQARSELRSAQVLILVQALRSSRTGKSWLPDFSPTAATTTVALVRYKTNGSLDTTFNGTGKITTAIGLDDDLGLSMALQANGKIIVAGASITDAMYGGAEIAVLRYNSNGTLDDTFNGTGIRTTAFRTIAFGHSVTLQPDGKIVVGGYSSNGDKSDFAVVRYMGGM